LLSSSEVLQIDLFHGLEHGIVAGIGIFSVLLLALSITAYRKTHIKQTIYAIVIFALFAIQLTIDYFDNIFSVLDSPITDAVIDSLTLAILVLFFIAIVRTKNSIGPKKYSTR
jgi:tryptophan-rich sensory protein